MANSGNAGDINGQRAGNTLTIAAGVTAIDGGSGSINVSTAALDNLGTTIDTLADINGGSR